VALELVAARVKILPPAEFVKHLNRGKATLQKDPIHFNVDRDTISVEVAMQYNDTYVEQLFSFANNIRTMEGGTHLVGFKAALTRTLNTFATRNNMLDGLRWLEPRP